MSVDLEQYRQSAREQARIADLMAILPKERSSILEVGARDGYISRLLTAHFEKVIALDLVKPGFDIPGVIPVAGDVTSLAYAANSFDVAICTEVLEHISPSILSTACLELARVARSAVVVGVPYKQDIRVGRTTCQSCGAPNPPWGHVNSFDERSLQNLFAGLRLVSTTYVGSRRERTNSLSTFLMDFAGNPWGTYDQEEPCVRCGKRLQAPQQRTLLQTLSARIALRLVRMQERFASPTANWMHMVFAKDVFAKDE
jgi:hypothetical protein